MTDQTQLKIIYIVFNASLNKIQTSYRSADIHSASSRRSFEDSDSGYLEGNERCDISM